MDDALIVYGQNGEAVRPEQGYPLRLLVPGYEAINSTSLGESRWSTAPTFNRGKPTGTRLSCRRASLPMAKRAGSNSNWDPIL